MQHILLLLVFCTTFFLGCDKRNAEQGEKDLDLLLKRAPLMTINIKRHEGENSIIHTLNETNAQQFISELSKTNRQAITVNQWKMISCYIEFSAGTNFETRIAIYDGKSFHYRDYDFVLKSSSLLQNVIEN